MSKRFKEKNARVLVDELIARGLDVLAEVEPPSTSLFDGCGNPECCWQHSGLVDGEPMLSVRTTISGSQLHRLAKELGLI